MNSENFLVMAYAIGLVLLWGYAVVLLLGLKKSAARVARQNETIKN